MEVFFAKQSPKTGIQPHSDGCNFILTAVRFVLCGEGDDRPTTAGDGARPSYQSNHPLNPTHPNPTQNLIHHSTIPTYHAHTAPGPGGAGRPVLDQGGRGEAGVAEWQGHGLRHALLPRDGLVSAGFIRGLCDVAWAGVGGFVVGRQFKP